MPILVIGLILFLGVHMVRVVAPAEREALMIRLGDGAYRGIYSLISIVGFVLIVWGFARASSNDAFAYVPPDWGRPLAEALMLPALILAVASALPAGYIKGTVRHPLIIATILWAAAHLFVNGTVATLVLFAAFLVWAVVDLISFTRRSAPPTESEAPRLAADAIAVVAGAALYGLLVWRLHAWLFGVSPLG